jgi:drug/metabolite transporter (DMT)-like permease
MTTEQALLSFTLTAGLLTITPGLDGTGVANYGCGGQKASNACRDGNLFRLLILGWKQKFSGAGFYYSLLTGICVGAGTIAFFLLFQKGGPLSSVPAILAGGAAIMAIAGILFFREAPLWQRIVGVAFAILGLFLLRK